jgi:protein TonB
MVTVSNNWIRERPLAAAILISFVIHAMALTLFPQLRTLKREPDSPLQVDILPPAREAAPAQAPAAAAAPVPETRPLPVPPPERPRVRSAKPVPSVTTQEPAPIAAPLAPQADLLTASPEAPPQASQFSVPAAPERTEGTASPVREVAPSAPPEPDLLEGYGHALSQAIGRHQRYPRIAQMRGWQGTATVAVPCHPRIWAMRGYR